MVNVDMLSLIMLSVIALTRYSQIILKTPFLFLKKDYFELPFGSTFSRSAEITLSFISKFLVFITILKEETQTFKLKP